MINDPNKNNEENLKEEINALSNVAINNFIPAISAHESVKKYEKELYSIVKPIKCPVCGANMKLDYKSSLYWKCPNFKEYRCKTKSADTVLQNDPKIIYLINKIKEFNEKENLSSKRSLSEYKFKFSKSKNELFRSENIDIGINPYMSDGTVTETYYFQSLALPPDNFSTSEIPSYKPYSKFKVISNLPRKEVEIANRTIFSLSLRLLSRGIVLPTNSNVYSKIKSIFNTDVNSVSKLSTLFEYIDFSAVNNNYDSEREKKFAETYFPLILGKTWTAYVHPQVLIEHLVKDSKGFENQRVDFFIYKNNYRIVIELDGKEHEDQKEYDERRDELLKNNGIIVIRFTNKEVDSDAARLHNELNAIKSKCYSDEPSIQCNIKQLIACKLQHQFAIAILKLLEEGHINCKSNLSTKINTSLISKSEQKLILELAIKEVYELVEHFSVLYGLSIDLNLLDKSAAPHCIYVGNESTEDNFISIRDIDLPKDYLSATVPFSLNYLPSNVTKTNLEFFLNYLFGFDSFREGQYEAIERTLMQKESIVLLPTGSGKSIIYQLCSFLLPGITIVISPLRALIADQISNLNSVGINCAAGIFSSDSVTKEKLEDKAWSVISGRSGTLLYIAPERLQIHSFREKIKSQLITNNISLIAIDEAHCVSEWGHDFRAAYLGLGDKCRKLFKKEDFVPPIIALTGTASENVLKDVQRDLSIKSYDAMVTPQTFDRPELHFSAIPCPACDKYSNIEKLINVKIPEYFNSDFSEFMESENENSGIVFTTIAAPKRPGNMDSWSLFCKLSRGFPSISVGTYFSKIPPNFVESKNIRTTWEDFIKGNAELFKRNEINLLVATKAFGMGIDKPNIRYVIHNSLPNSIEQYYQEVGRAGRDRDHAECVLLFSNDNEEDNDKLLNMDDSWLDSKIKTSFSIKDDMSTIVYFHNQSFKGKDFEKDIVYKLLSKFRDKNGEFAKEKTTTSISLPELIKSIKESKIKLTANGDKVVYQENLDDDTYLNEILRATVRLSTLGIIYDYEYDYGKKILVATLGCIDVESVIEHYTRFVEGYGYGQAKSEAQKAKTYKSYLDKNELYFIRDVVDLYISFIYRTIEHGRRRAIRSMYSLAKNAVGINQKEKQDEFIRETIKDYLAVKDDVTDRVIESVEDCGFSVISEEYIDNIENFDPKGALERAKKTNQYTARQLETYPFHPGLLYLNVLTSLKLEKYDDKSIIHDLRNALYSSIEKYSIPLEQACEFYIKTLSVVKNVSNNLFYESLVNVTENFSDKNLISTFLSSEGLESEEKQTILLTYTNLILKKLTGGRINESR